MVADDLTGAMDGGVQLLARTAVEVLVSGAAAALPATSRAGARAHERTPATAARAPAPVGAGVLPVVNTQSRGLAPAAAAVRVSAACRALSAAGRAVWFKKLDSTLRGNVGAELAALHEALAPCVIVCTPALPAEGRTVEGGVLLVAGEPVMGTPYRDEIPAGSGAGGGSSAVVDIVRRQWRGCAAVHLPAPGGGALRAALDAAPHLISVDGASDADLLAVAAAAEAALHRGRRLVWAGSAGLLRALTLTGAPDIGAQPRGRAPERFPSAAAVRRPRPMHSRAGFSSDRRVDPPAPPSAAAPPPEWPARQTERQVQPAERQAQPGHRTGAGCEAPHRPPTAPAYATPETARSRPGAVAVVRAAAGTSATGACVPARAPVLVVCGSRRAMARRQVDNASAASRSRLTVSLAAAPGAAPDEPRWRFAAAGGAAPREVSGSAAAVHCAAALDSRRDLFLCAPAPPESAEASAAAGTAPAEAVADALAALAAGTLEAAAERPLALLLIGGETAYACLQRLAIARLALTGEAEPYVPRARVSGGPWHGMTVITKAGGFGDPHTLSRICARLGEAG